jgi:exonuclease SbcC
MIPVRLTMSGFLTYRDEVELDFTGIRTAVLVGENGHGKSSIFDAITFALFGAHRGGTYHADMLINQERSKLAVRFEFEVDGQAYRLDRTLERTGRSVAHEAIPQIWDGKEFVAIPDHTGPDKCTPWVVGLLGMNFKTCCASVLLRQDDQARFIKAEPRERQEILNALLDLEPYRKLELRAVERVKSLGDTLAQFRKQQADLPAYDAESLCLAEKAGEQARADRERADGALGDAQRRLAAAQLHTSIVERVDGIDGELRVLTGLLSDQKRISANAARHEAVERIIPPYTAAVAAAEDVKDADERAERARTEADGIDLDAGRREVKNAVDGVRRAKEALGDAQAAEKRLRDEELALRPLGTALANAKTSRDDADDRRRAADQYRAAADDLEAAAKALNELRRLKVDQPWMGILRDARQAAADADDRARDAGEEVDATEAALPGVRSAAEKAAEGSRAASDKVRDQIRDLASAEQIVVQFGEQIEEREDAAGEPVCRRCGAPIDAERLAGELAELKAKRSRAVEEQDRLSRALAEAKKRETTAQEVASKAAAAVTQLERRRDLATAAQYQANKDHSAARSQQATALERLSERLQRAATEDPTFPSTGVLGEVAGRLKTMPSAETRARQATDAATHLEKLETEAGLLEKHAKGQEALVPVARRDRVRARWGVINSEIAGAATLVREAEGKVAAAARTEDAATTRLANAEQQRSRLLTTVAQAKSESLAQEKLRDAAIAMIPLAARPRSLDRATADALKAELGALGPFVERKRALDTAEASIKDLRSRRAELERQRAEIDTNDRVPVGQAQGAVDEASSLLEDARSVERRVQNELQAVLDAAKAGTELDKKVRATDAQLVDWRLLASLLGKGQLQGKLVEDARIGIAERANEELDAISGGSLRLEMIRNAKTDELKLMVHDTSSVSRPIDAHYLSGSQRFRVAVAIALGIGQHVGGAARGQRAVIIDEGFGSLDADGIEAMAQHLHDLSDRLDRVLVVTHHKAMQRHFANGFTITKTDKVSRVERWSGSARLAAANVVGS